MWFQLSKHESSGTPLTQLKFQAHSNDRTFDEVSSASLLTTFTGLVVCCKRIAQKANELALVSMEFFLFGLKILSTEI